jgi:ABC-type sugar transport system ATPase subunit
MTASQAGNGKGNGTAPLLEIDHVSKYFGNVIALKDVSAIVHEGEVTCVLGDNGAGKSTFIKILSGVHKQLAARGEGARHRDRVPGPCHGAADVDLAELLPRV